MQHRDCKRSARRRGLGGRATLALLLATVVVITGALSLWPGTSAATKAPPAPEPGCSPGAKPGFDRLKGRWQRPDGGYVIDIKDIEAGGQMTAAYFNPRPITVSQAQAALDGNTLKVFVELRDVNYPGATYNLTYDPQSDQLQGVYFQPALQQSFEIFFVRLK